ncbi:hypothetical protein BDZ45DRAFT_205985 [Acephala macrosclerotiorum]|nr:hypothetical protein BDZ45DRAFT_205985 [Acephala macrosclerotiorum]
MASQAPEEPAQSSEPCPAARDLWKRAIDTLNDDIKRDIDLKQTDQLIKIEDDVLAAVQGGKETCKKKRWRHRKGGHDIIIRDKLEKIVKWVEKFVEVGDTIVQYDPGHAALPWASVRFLLKIATNDCQIYGAMVDGVEHISNLITRYHVLEAIYLKPVAGGDSKPREQFEASLVKLYAAIMLYLVKARRFFEKSTVRRMAGAVVQSPPLSSRDLLFYHQKLQVTLQSLPTSPPNY